MAISMFVLGFSYARSFIQALALIVLTSIPASQQAIFAQVFSASDPHKSSLESVKDSAAISPPIQGAPATQATPEELGDLDMLHKQYQAAIKAYSQAPQKSPAIWNKLGIANQQMLLLDEARKSYETSLRLDPQNADVINNLGTILFTLKQYHNAEKLYRRALRINPKASLIYKNLGTDLVAEGKFKKSLDCFQTALTLDPTVLDRVSYYHISDPTSLQIRGAMNYYLAKSYARAGMYDRAIDFLRMAIDERFADRKKILADQEFAALRGLPAFEQLFVEQTDQ